MRSCETSSRKVFQLRQPMGGRSAGMPPAAAAAAAGGRNGEARSIAKASDIMVRVCACDRAMVADVGEIMIRRGEGMARPRDVGRKGTRFCVFLGAAPRARLVRLCVGVSIYIFIYIYIVCSLLLYVKANNMV